MAGAPSSNAPRQGAGNMMMPPSGGDADRTMIYVPPGGGNAQQQVMPAPAPAPAPSAPSNIFTQAAGAQRGAQRAYEEMADFRMTPMQAAQLGPAREMRAAQLGPAREMQSVGQVADVSAPGQIDVNQLATTDLGAYMSPYEQAVVEAGQRDIERQRQMASENLAAQAQRAGAFGGSRQAVQEGILASEALRQAGQLSAQQRQAGFTQALRSGQFDIGQMQAARTLASQQSMQANTLNQRAAEAAAQREQAARAGNMAAANQFAQQQAQLEQAARSANMAAANQFAIQQAQFEQAANQANFGGQFSAANVRQAGAAGLGGLGQQMFGQGMGIQQQQMAFGQQQRAMNQALIDAARGQYGGFTGAPQASLALPLQAVGMAPHGQIQTTSGGGGGGFGSALGGIGGLLGGIAQVAPLFPSDIRLKKDIKKIGETKGGHNLYTWKWRDEAKESGLPLGPERGVVAQEVMERQPEAVHRHESGYLMVDYGAIE